MVTAIRECCDQAAGLRCDIAIQNHHESPYTESPAGTPAQHRSAELQARFDAWSPACGAESVRDGSRPGAPHVDHHLRRLRPAAALPLSTRPHQLRPGGPRPRARRAYRRRELAIADFLGLRNGGFDGWADYEMCSPMRGGGAAENLDGFAALCPLDAGKRAAALNSVHSRTKDTLTTKSRQTTPVPRAERGPSRLRPSWGCWRRRKRLRGSHILARPHRTGASIAARRPRRPSNRRPFSSSRYRWKSPVVSILYRRSGWWNSSMRSGHRPSRSPPTPLVTIRKLEPDTTLTRASATASP